MITLNLDSYNASVIPYKIIKFPDGQQDVEIVNIYYPSIEKYAEVLQKEHIVIQKKIFTFRDFELVLCTTQALRNLGVNDISLSLPYLFGARSDRQFKIGGTSYLLNVIAPIINSQNYLNVFVTDVHSEQAKVYINNLHNLMPNVAIANFLNETKETHSQFVVVAPDKGALKRTTYIAENCMLDFKSFVQCSKVRNSDGIISITMNIEKDVNLATNPFIIFDDICDGGGTFIEIGRLINKYRESTGTPKEQWGKNYLFVTHGLFTKGFDELFKYYDKIGFTDSVIEDVKQYKNSDKLIVSYI